MHHSDDPSRETAVVSGYFDESGTDDLSPLAVVGGLLLNKSGFRIFQDEWDGMLATHKVPYIHMKEFGRHGKLGNLDEDESFTLLADAVAIINSYKIRSMAAVLTTAEYDANFQDLIGTRKDMSLYCMCFILCVVVNHKVAEAAEYYERIPFLMDEGNNYAPHVLKAHKTALKFQKEKFLNMGELTFEDDEEIKPLQAADMISWAVRRKTRGVLDKGFQPLTELFDAKHAEAPFQTEYLRELAESLAIIAKNGKVEI
jgi:Protein of unknown function (DUF3800)